MLDGEVSLVKRYNLVITANEVKGSRICEAVLVVLYTVSINSQLQQINSFHMIVKRL